MWNIKCQAFWRLIHWLISTQANTGVGSLDGIDVGSGVGRGVLRWDDDRAPATRMR